MPGDEPRPVSGFGYLRVKAWLAAHRSFSQPSHVLRRLSTPRHPPSTLSNLTTFLSRSLAREQLFKSRSIVGDHIPEVVKDHQGRSCRPPPCGLRSGGAGHRKVRCSGGAGHRVSTEPARTARASMHFLPFQPGRRALVVEATGIEPATPCLQSRSSTIELRPRNSPAWPAVAWWAYVDSNHRPYAYQAYALTT